MFPELTPWVAQPRVAGKPCPMPCPPSAPGREGENEWPWPRAGGGAQRAGPGELGCAEPVWPRPKAFEAFCGYWLLLHGSLFQPFHSQPRQETSGSSSPPPVPSLGRFGKQKSSLGDVLGSVLEEDFCTGIGRSQYGEESCQSTLIHPCAFSQASLFPGPWCSHLCKGVEELKVLTQKCQ